jgi:hypothetical protein
MPIGSYRGGATDPTQYVILSTQLTVGHRPLLGPGLESGCWRLGASERSALIPKLTVWMSWEERFSKMIVSPGRAESTSG